MNNLWAPWRMQYITSIGRDDGSCIFCSKPGQNNDRDNLILFRGTKNFIILNLFPYNNGHLMVVPFRHTCDCCDLDAETGAELWRMVAGCKRALDAALHPDGFNIGMNIGRAGGAGIDQHIHMHIVPRWSGDSNFMPVVGGTKVISQAILDTYDILLPYCTDAMAGIS